MLGGLFRLFLLNKIFGGAGRTGGRRGRGGCGMGAGCLVVIVIIILAIVLLRGWGGGDTPAYDF